MDLTNPSSPGRRVTMRVFLLFMLVAFVMIVFSHTEYTYRRPRYRSLPLLYCDDMPPGLGPIKVNRTPLDLEEMEEYAFPEVMWGGTFTPINCTPIDRVAIIVPYRDRELQLPVFLNHMHKFLMKQEIQYGIFIVEQASRHDYFNRGKLLNVGFVESLKLVGWSCYIFHDIELLPLDERNIYSCPHPEHPRHLAVAIDYFNFKLPYKTRFSGAVAMTYRQFVRVNGFSNTYWGFGGEDDDMVSRLHAEEFTIARYNDTIARYASLNHTENPENKNQRYQWHKSLMEVKGALPRDGMSTLNYTLRSVVPHRLYTHIKADIGRSPTYDQLLKILKKFKLWQDSDGDLKNLEELKKEFIALL